MLKIHGRIMLFFFILIIFEVSASYKPKSPNATTPTNLDKRKTPTLRRVRIDTNSSPSCSRSTIVTFRADTPTTSPSSPGSNQSLSPPENDTKFIIIIASIFVLIFVLLLLIIGHFTWFADIRKDLEEEWEEEKRRQENLILARKILNEMDNRFLNFEQEREYRMNQDFRRRSSIDSNGCTHGLCVPPHHSVLCPNNINIPSLSDPYPNYSSTPTSLFLEDPIEYRNSYRRATDCMNLESCVKISQPIPMRNRMPSLSSSYYYSQKRPAFLVPLTPDPFSNNEHSPNENDLESGSIGTNNFNLDSSPALNFDLSKLDLI